MAEYDGDHEGKVRIKPARNLDFWVLALIAAAMIGGFIALTFKLIDQEDRHVDDVGKVRISRNFSEDLIDKNDDAATVNSIVDADPNTTECDLSTVNVDDELMQKVAKLKRLKILNLSHSKITDRGLKYLADMPLKELDLSGTVVTDEGLELLAQKTGLFSLDLSSTKITNTGLKTLCKLPGLAHLFINGTKITDSGVAELVRMKSLKRLYIGNTPVSNDVFKSIAKMKLFALYIDHTAITCDGMKKYMPNSKIRKIGMEGCRISDDDVSKLMASVPAVEILNVGRTQITDAGLLQLARLPNLRTIRISTCPNLTDSGIKRFSKLRPDCRVETHYI